MPEGLGGGVSPSRSAEQPSTPRSSSSRELGEQRGPAARDAPWSWAGAGKVQTKAASPFWLVELCLLFGDCSCPSPPRLGENKVPSEVLGHPRFVLVHPSGSDRET